MAVATIQGNPILGNVQEFSANPLTFIQKAAELGDYTRFRLGPFNARLLRRAEDVHDVLVTHADKFSKDFLSKFSGKKFLGNGLVINEGASWRTERKRLQPAFYHENLAKYSEVIVQQSLAAIKHWNSPVQLDIALAELTMEIVSRTLFDSNVPDEAEKIRRVMSNFHEVMKKEYRSPIAALMPDWLPTHHKAMLRQCVRDLDIVVNKAIQERMFDYAGRTDLLSMLIAANQGDMMSDEQLHDEVITLFIAGHETTANAVSWLFYLLAQNPTAEQKVKQEIAQVVGDRAPQFADYNQLKYTQMAIKETLRLYPVGWMFGRQATEDVQIGEVCVNRSEFVYLCPYITQRDGRYFDSPERFVPERFEGDNEKQLPKGSYFPFGGGPRICLGNQFAMLEMVLMVASVYGILPGLRINQQPISIDVGITLRPQQRLIGTF